jgi:hypothetical protein
MSKFLTRGAAPGLAYSLPAHRQGDRGHSAFRPRARALLSTILETIGETVHAESTGLRIEDAGLYKRGCAFFLNGVKCECRFQYFFSTISPLYAWRDSGRRAYGEFRNGPLQ